MTQHDETARQLVDSFALTAVSRNGLVLDIAAALKAAAEAEREECAKAMCLLCAEGNTPADYGEPFGCAHKGVSGERFPTYATCRAAALRARGEKGEG